MPRRKNAPPKASTGSPSPGPLSRPAPIKPPLGHFLMAFENMTCFYSALGLIIAGVGFLKPNVSTQVGALYKPGDPRRDGAFTIFFIIFCLQIFIKTSYAKSIIFYAIHTNCSSQLLSAR